MLQSIKLASVVKQKQSSRGVLWKNLVKFTGKPLCQSLFLITLQPKKKLWQSVSLFYGTPPAAASGKIRTKSLKSTKFQFQFFLISWTPSTLSQNVAKRDIHRKIFVAVSIHIEIQTSNYLNQNSNSFQKKKQVNLIYSLVEKCGVFSVNRNLLACAFHCVEIHCTFCTFCLYLQVLRETVWHHALHTLKICNICTCANCNYSLLHFTYKFIEMILC